MVSGSSALLDHVAGIAELAAASLDDADGRLGHMGLEAAGVVVDDPAVTPRSVSRLRPDRALSAIATAALIRVGGGILLHGLAVSGAPAPAHPLDLAAAGPGRRASRPAGRSWRRSRPSDG